MCACNCNLYVDYLISIGVRVGDGGVGVQEQGGRQDARVRPRRAHRHAPRRRQAATVSEGQPRGHGEARVPAGGYHVLQSGVLDDVAAIFAVHVDTDRKSVV